MNYRKITISIILLLFILGFPTYSPIPELTTSLVSELLYITGTHVVNYDNVIFLNLQDQLVTLSISPECTGVMVLLLFTFVMFITPGIKMEHRFASLLFIPLIYSANIFRIMSGIVVGKYTSVNMMLIYHSSIGQVILFAFVIISYILFLKLFGYHKKDKPYTNI